MPDANANRNTSHLEGELLSIKASLVETSASQFMDELFAELEQDLDGSSLATPAVSSQTALPSASAQALSVDYYPLEAANAGSNPGPTGQAAQSQTTDWHLNNHLLLPGVAAAAGTLLLWVGSQLHQPRAAPPTPVPSVADGSDSAANRAFATYLQRSLDRINQNNQTKQAAIASAPIPQTVSLPTLNPPTPASNDTSSGVKVTERVYIPVYQPPQPQTVSIKPSPAAKPEKAAALPSPGAKTAAPAKPTTLTPTQTLVGVLELGDRSAALVGVNGITRRVHVGESLGLGGWSLVKVANQKAIIQRKGELRSLYVGQKF